MKLSPSILNKATNAVTSTAINVPDDEQEADNSSTILSRDEMYIVTVDSRGRSPSDLEGYREISCNNDFWLDHIRDDPNNICMKSQVAGLCGLDLEMYFHDPTPNMIQLEELHCPLSPIGRTNGAATLLLFNPETGKFNHVVYGKAYVLLNGGGTPLSKRQVWGIIELIREARKMYESMEDKYGPTSTENKTETINTTTSEQQHYDEPVAVVAPVDHSSSPALQHAHKELMNWCSHYKQGTWYVKYLKKKCLRLFVLSRLLACTTD
jgi:hypothetical protein